VNHLNVLRTAVVLVFGSGAPVIAGAQGQAPTPAAPPQIVTSAQGEGRVTPDRATVHIGVQTRRSTSTAAARDNAVRQRAVIDTLVALGVPREMVSTENYNVFPETRYDTNTQRTQVTGYVVSNVVRVELRRTDLVGSVIDAAVAKGANQINSLDFTASNADSARRAALGSAIAQARGDAEAMARASGGSLGNLLELTSSDMGGSPVYRRTFEMNAGQAARAPSPIEPGEQTLRVMVMARWQFVPGSAPR
jgi:uncharacterized protein